MLKVSTNCNANTSSSSSFWSTSFILSKNVPILMVWVSGINSADIFYIASEILVTNSTLGN